jgi:glycosyltransferase 2 family protein
LSKQTKLLLRLAFTLLLLGFLGYRMDLGEFFKVLISAQPALILLATMMQASSVLLSVARWRVILRNFSMMVEFSPLTKITFIGNFFNLFLPSAIGGDFFRAYYLSKRNNRGMSTTLTTTVLERSAGLCALLAIGTFFAATRRIEIQGFYLLYLFLGLVLLYVLANVALFHSWMHDKITRFFQRWNLKDVENKLELVYDGLMKLRKNRQAIVVSLFISLVIQFVSVVIMWVAARSIGIEASFFIFLVFIPIVNLTIMIPLTINGFGLRESAYALLFTQIGVAQETAVALSLLNFLIVTLASLPGAVIYSVYRKEEHLDELLSEAETS